MLRAAVCVLLAFGSWQPAYAWGDEGHRITGYIANTLLSDATRQQLRALIGTDDLSQIATWMDDERDALNRRWPGSSRWHYENRPTCDQANGTARVCPKGECITRQIEHFRTVLHNRLATNAQRAEAVRVLVHLLGDLHQPLHLADNNDRGGNDVLVRLPHEKDPRRLHEVWDTRLLRLNLRRDEASYARALLSRMATNSGAWQTGAIEPDAIQQWAAESHRIASESAYRPLPGFSCRIAAHGNNVLLLPVSYVDHARVIIDEQLAKAGARIAAVLNQELGAG